MPEFNDQPELLNEHAPKRAQPDGDREHGLDLASTLGNAHVGQVLHAPGVQRAGATSAQHLDESVAQAIEQRKGRGEPLDKNTRTDMEGALGHDLSDVRVHTDRDAHQLNESVSARAFTSGNDVFFKQGTYDPGSSSGRELLGHELTHVVQQRTGTSGLSAGEISHPSDAAEQHAEAVGRTLSAPQPAAPAASASSPAGVSREALPEEEEPEVAAAREPGTSIARQVDDELDEETA